MTCGLKRDNHIEEGEIEEGEGERKEEEEGLHGLITALNRRERRPIKTLRKKGLRSQKEKEKKKKEKKKKKEEGGGGGVPIAAERQASSRKISGLAKSGFDPETCGL